MSEKILQQFGHRVREERMRKRLSQEELASLAGMHRTYIGMVERAERNITLKNIEKIADALDITVNDLIGDI